MSSLSGISYLSKLVKNLAKRKPKYLNSEKRASVCLILRLQENSNNSYNYNNDNNNNSNNGIIDNNMYDLYDKNEKKIILDDNNFDHFNELECLFIKRAIIQQDPWSGQVALPGGKQEEQDKISFSSEANTKKNSTFQILYNNILGQPTTITYYMNPECEGTMFFFPSKLQHQVYPLFNCDEDRMSISGYILLNTN